MTKMVRNDLGTKRPGYEMTGYWSKGFDQESLQSNSTSFLIREYEKYINIR